MTILKTLLIGVFAVSVCMNAGCSTTRKAADSTMTEAVDRNTVMDVDGNVYKTVRIGKQVWMAENLRATKYNDGSPITLVSDSAAWRRIYDSSLATQAYCYYNNTTNSDSIKKYGALYNWFVVETKKLAPKGWHVPSDAEWDTLQSYLIANGYNWDTTKDSNKIAKALAAKTDWNDYHSPTTTGVGKIGCDLTKNNRSGFSALPGGYRIYDGAFLGKGFSGCWWSATCADLSWQDIASFRDLDCTFELLHTGSLSKRCGRSVRLLKDN